MSDPNFSPEVLSDFPPVPPGHDRVRFVVVADRVDPADDQGVQASLLAIGQSSLTGNLIDDLVELGFDRNKIYASTSMEDSEPGPIVRLADVYPEAPLEP